MGDDSEAIIDLLNSTGWSLQYLIERGWVDIEERSGDRVCGHCNRGIVVDAENTSLTTKGRLYVKMRNKRIDEATAKLHGSMRM